eukprot:COSAG01_NODE_63501_length_279_cov_4.811111_1_plen_42_part_10
MSGLIVVLMGCELRPTLPVHKLRPWKQTGKVVDSTCTQTEAL